VKSALKAPDAVMEAEIRPIPTRTLAALPEQLGEAVQRALGESEGYSAAG